MADKRPAFQWYPKDYLTDENVVSMTLEEEGAYRRLMDYCWLHGSLPNDMDRLGAMCKVDGSRMALLWSAIGKCFTEDENRWVHPRLEHEKHKQNKHLEAKSRAGKKGAKARWEKEKDGSAIDVPMAKDSSSSASSTAVKEKSSKKRNVQRPSDWEPNLTHRRIAKEEGLDTNREAEKFGNFHDAKGNTFIDWDKAFCVWLRKAGEFQGNANGGNSKPDPLRERLR